MRICGLICWKMKKVSSLHRSTVKRIPFALLVPQASEAFCKVKKHLAASSAQLHVT